MEYSLYTPQIIEYICQQQELLQDNMPTQELEIKLVDLNRKLIAEFTKDNGFILLGKINVESECINDKLMDLYQGQVINKHAYDFCIPAYDRLLADFILEWRVKKDSGTPGKIYERIKSLGGVLLFWQQ